MSDYAILRIAKRSLGQAAAMARHALREAATPNADPARRTDNTVLGPETSAGVMAALRAKLPAKRRKDAVPCIEVFVGGSPEAMAKMTRQQQDAYFEDALRWIGGRFGGGQNLVSAVVHRDETTPHLQVLLVPLLDGRLNAKRLVGNRSQMSQMQTDFAEQVGRPHGLRRGEKGSRAKHTSIRAFYAAIERAGSVDALPPRVPVPPEPPALTIFASSEVKADHARRMREREAAIEANRRREQRIMELARVGLAAKGRLARRELPAIEHEVEVWRGHVERAKMLLSEQRREHEARQQQLAAVEREIQQRREVLQLGQLELEAQRLRHEVRELHAEREALTRPQRQRYRPG